MLISFMLDMAAGLNQYWLEPVKQRALFPSSNWLKPVVE
jgi:hypothetical protein